jgi:hypothetical protein
MDIKVGPVNSEGIKMAEVGEKSRLMRKWTRFRTWTETAPLSF